MLGRLVIFGGTGFLGSAVVREARGRNLSVVAVARGNRRSTAGFFPDVIADITRPGSLPGTIRHGDVVLNLVGLSPVRRPRGGRRAYGDAHLRGTRNLTNLADTVGAQRFIYISALGVHRDCGAAYGETKALAEATVRRARTPSVVIAPSLILGPGSEISAALEMISHLPLRWIPVPDITAAFRPTDVADAARTIVDWADGTIRGTTHEYVPLVGPERVTGFEIAANHLTYRGKKVIRVPAAAIRPFIALISGLKLPGMPADLQTMLAIDNAGDAPTVG